MVQFLFPPCMACWPCCFCSSGWGSIFEATLGYIHSVTNQPHPNLFWFDSFKSCFFLSRDTWITFEHLKDQSSTAHTELPSLEGGFSLCWLASTRLEHAMQAAVGGRDKCPFLESCFCWGPAPDLCYTAGHAFMKAPCTPTCPDRRLGPLSEQRRQAIPSTGTRCYSLHTHS